MRATDTIFLNLWLFNFVQICERKRKAADSGWSPPREGVPSNVLLTSCVGNEAHGDEADCEGYMTTAAASSVVVTAGHGEAGGGEEGEGEQITRHCVSFGAMGRLQPATG